MNLHFKLYNNFFGNQNIHKKDCIFKNTCGQTCKDVGYCETCKTICNNIYSHPTYKFAEGHKCYSQSKIREKSGLTQEQKKHEKSLYETKKIESKKRLME